MARKDRTLAGFGDVADNDKENINNNENKNINVDDESGDSPDYLDKLLETGGKKDDLQLRGLYLEPDLAHLLDKLGRQGGRGAKSRIANDALRKYFKDKGLL